MPIATFKHLIQLEMEAIEPQSMKNNMLYHHLCAVETANSINDFFNILNKIDPEARMPLVAKSRAIHTLMMAHPESFIAFFSHDHIKAIIYQLCAIGNVTLVKCLIEKVVGNLNREELLLNAFRSGSKPMVKYLLETLKLPLYDCDKPTEFQKKSMDSRVLKLVAKSGSVGLFEYLENELEIPVDDIINEELETTKLYHHIKGELILINAICSYQVEFLQYLFETKGLMPSTIQLTQLLGYAYDNGRHVPQHKKFVTLAYVYGFIHENTAMRALLYRVAEISELSVLTTADLFALFADFTQHFQESSHQFTYGKRFRENSIYLGDEIARRKPSKQDLLDLAKRNKGEQAPNILYFLVVMGKGYSDEEVTDILRHPIFDATYRFHSGNTPLHHAILHHRRTLINILLEKGADPDAKNDAHQTPLSLLEMTDKVYFTALLSHARDIKNSMMYCIKVRESEHIAPLMNHLHGQVEPSEVMTWIEWCKNCPTNLYNIFSNLNETTFKQVKQMIFAENNPSLIHALAYAEHFKKTGAKPKALLDYEQAMYHINLVNLFGNEPCEARVVFGLALLSLQTDQPNPYPAFLQTLNIKKRELTAEKVAHALWLNHSDPDEVKVSKLSFTLWAKTASLPFDIQDVDKYLESRYGMN